jgi:hypothetical protein
VLDADDIAELTISIRPLRNFTPQQWHDLTAKLPPGAKPTPHMFAKFLLGANAYWVQAPMPPLRLRVRLMAEAVEHLNAALEKIQTASRTRDEELAQLAQITGEIERNRDNMQTLLSLVGRATRDLKGKDEFLAAALELWEECGGKLAFSRSSPPSGEPGGPLIRYLKFASRLVMGKQAPGAETLATFARRWRRQHK